MFRLLRFLDSILAAEDRFSNYGGSSKDRRINWRRSYARQSVSGMGSHRLATVATIMGFRFLGMLNWSINGSYDDVIPVLPTE